MNKKNIFTIALILILVAGSVTAIILSKSNKQSITVDTPKAFGFEAIKINGKYVSTEIFSEEYGIFYEKWKRNAEMIQKTDDERNDMLLDKIIERVVLDDYFESKSSIMVNDTEVDNYIEKNIKTRFTTQSQLSDFMTSSNYKDEEDMKNGIREYILKHKCYLESAKNFLVTPDENEIDQQYKLHKIINRSVDFRHLLISNSTRTDEEALALASQIYSKIKNGENFENMVEQYSDDQKTKDNGGLIKNAMYNSTENTFYDIVFNAEPGQLLEPIKVHTGYEIALVERNEAFYKSREEYTDILTVNKFLNSKEEYTKWVDSLKESYEIEITGSSFKAFRLFKKGEFDEASKEYETAYNETNDINFIEKASEAYRLLGDWDNLIRVSNIGIKNDSEDIKHYLYNAEGLYKKGQEKEALSVMQKAESISKDNTYLLSLIYNTYENLGLSDDANRISQKISGKK